jgi:hypothetical protein
LSNKETKYSFKSKKPGKTKAFFICLLISAFLWVIHSLNTVYNYTFKIPVTFKNLPHNKKPVMQIPEVLTVDVKASGLKIAMILMNRPFKTLDVDFNNLKKVNRNRNYILSASGINLRRIFRFETQVKHITPDTLYFSEKTGFQRSVPVKVPLFIRCAEGYGYTKPVVSPSYVTIWGDTSAVQKTDTLYTQPLTLTNVSKNVSETVPFIRPSDNLYTAINEAHILIEVSRLVEYTVSVPISDVARDEHTLVNIYPPKATLRFTAVQNSFHLSDTASFKVLINSARVNQRTNKCALYIGTAPGNVTVMDIEPREAEILILGKKSGM